MYTVEYYNLGVSGKDKILLANNVRSIIENIEKGDSRYQIFKKQDPERLDESLLQLARRIKESFSDLVVISMGGATLNPQMLTGFSGRNLALPRIFFLCDTDPASFAAIMAAIDIKNTAFVAISNSGETLETNSLVGGLLREYRKNNITDIKNRAFFITNPENGGLKSLAMAVEGAIIKHQPGISGRYSGLSAVSLLIGMIAGIDVHEYIAGANVAIDDFYDKMEASAPALSAGAIYWANKPILVNIGYLQRFSPFLEWYSQIIAESLGKEGGGYTPVRGLGPNDQHSMLQLYLGGPRDKLFTLFYARGDGSKLADYKTDNLEELGYLAGKSLSQINEANFNATLSALRTKELPLRVVTLEDTSPRAFGALVCHCMLEVVLLGHLMKINPFDQPGVELIKKYSKELVSKL